MERKGDWICTFTGLQVYPLDPRPEEIVIEDIAHALSMQCRFGGHIHFFYSVAQHSIELTRRAPDDLKLEALMHDSAETYLIDIPRPIKKFLPNYKEFEDKLLKVISEKFKFQYPFPEAIHELDDIAVKTEGMQFMIPGATDSWKYVTKTYWKEELDPWGPYTAETIFLEYFERYKR